MRSAQTLVDTGPLVAALNGNDPSHSDCLTALRQVLAPLLTCWPVITEAVYLLGSWSMPTAKLFELIRLRTVEIARLKRKDVDAIETIFRKYHDQGFHLGDVALMHLAESHDIDQVLRLDRKDFGIFRTRTGLALTLLPSAI